MLDTVCAEGVVVMLLWSGRVQENMKAHALSKTREGQGTAVAARNAGERCNHQGGQKVEPRRKIEIGRAHV